MPEPATFLLTALLVTLGASVSAMAGFGFAIVIMPFMLLLYPPTQAVVITLSTALCGASIQWLRVRRHTDYPLVARLIAGALLGVPLGGYILSIISTAALKVLIGLTVTTAALFNLLRPGEIDLPVRRPRTPVALVAGFLGGVLATTVSQPGIPIAALLAWTRQEKRVVRATLVTFFVPVYVSSVATFYIKGLLTRELGLTVLLLVPFYILGLYAGDWGFHRSGQASHRRLVLGVLSLSALMGLLSGVTALLG